MDFLCAFSKRCSAWTRTRKSSCFSHLDKVGAHFTSRPALAFITLHFVSLYAVIGIASSRLLGTQVVANLLRPQHFRAKLLYSGCFVLLQAFLQDASRSWTRPALVYVVFTLADTRGISFLSASLGWGLIFLAPFVSRSWVGVERRGPEEGR